MVWKGSGSFTEGNVLAELCESEVVFTGTAHFQDYSLKVVFPVVSCRSSSGLSGVGMIFWQGNV